MRGEDLILKIAMISEGAYPYISGGVSGWTQQLITEMNEFSFIIISIMPSELGLPEIKYDLPTNVVKFETIFLDKYQEISPSKQSREPRISSLNIKEVEKFINFDRSIDWEVLAKTITNKKKMGDSVEFLKSKAFWEMLLRMYEEKYKGEEFNRFYWTMQSMFMPLITILQTDLIEADIYHSVSTGYAGLLGMIFKLRHDRPLVLTEHGVYAREREEEIIKARWVEGVYKKMWIDYFYFLSTGTYKQANTVISLFERNKSMQLELGSDEDKTIVVPNGIEVDKFKLTKVKKNEKNILAVLRVVPIKDVKTLIRTFKVVKSKTESAKLYIVGSQEEDSEYYNECSSLVEFLDLNDCVIFTGQDDVRKYLKMADVLVLTSISEGQPLVMLEGMAAEVPIVATDVGSCKELIEGFDNDEIGHAGIITRTTSPSETANAILKIINDVKMSKKMGLNGLERVKKHYSKDAYIEAYRKCYTKLHDEKQGLQKELIFE